MSYLLGCLHLQVQKEFKLQVLTTAKFSEETHIFQILTLLQPKIPFAAENEGDNNNKMDNKMDKYPLIS